MNEPIYERMQQLIRQIRQADTAYYKHDAPIMSDLEYDRLIDDLVALEEESGVILSNSPTQHVAGETLETLMEVRHTKPMLSAAKTKSVDDLIRFAAGQDVLLSWKMDGLTLVLRYENGHLSQAITLEEYRQYGNSIILTDRHTQKTTYTATTDAFLAALSRMGEQNVDIRFDSCRSFYHPPRVSKQSKFDKLKQFYVLKAWSGYFVKRTRHGVMTIRTDNPTVATVRKFRTERAAQKYMEENAPFFSRVPFSVECVQPKEAAKAA